MIDTSMSLFISTLHNCITPFTIFRVFVLYSYMYCVYDTTKIQDCRAKMKTVFYLIRHKLKINYSHNDSAYSSITINKLNIYKSRKHKKYTLLCGQLKQIMRKSIQYEYFEK
jgi:hypothetical protein